MATTTLAPTRAEAIEQVLIHGNLAQLTPEQRTDYYRRVCDSLGLNPLTKPFEYLSLNGKLILYARKDCTEQLRTRDAVSVKIVARETTEGVYVVTAQASMPEGRIDESIGAVTIEGLKGEARANAIMKAETKAKRRVTLSICGLGMLDETEVADIPEVSQSQPRQLAERQSEATKHDAPKPQPPAEPTILSRCREWLAQNPTIDAVNAKAAEFAEKLKPELKDAVFGLIDKHCQSQGWMWDESLGSYTPAPENE